jgi:hypothetical protein
VLLPYFTPEYFTRFFDELAPLVSHKNRDLSRLAGLALTEFITRVSIELPSRPDGKQLFEFYEARFVEILNASCDPFKTALIVRCVGLFAKNYALYYSAAKYRELLEKLLQNTRESTLDLQQEAAQIHLSANFEAFSRLTREVESIDQEFLSVLETLMEHFIIK